MEEHKKQSIINKFISKYIAAKYNFFEPRKLKKERIIHENEYLLNNKEPLISVYIPTYNRAEILMERAIPTVLAQSYQNFELIVIGDHCTDDTEKNVKQIEDKRVKFFNIPKRGYRYPPTAENHWLAGPVVAANTALDMVQGKWIARIDDDDTWTEDHLEVLLDFAQKGNYEFVSGAYVAKRYGKQIVINVENETPRIGGTQTWLYRSYLKFMKYNINCWRKSWNRVNDTDLQDRFYKAGVRLGFIDKVVAYVLPRPGEETIGLEAYISNENQKNEHFKFEK